MYRQPLPLRGFDEEVRACPLNSLERFLAGQPHMLPGSGTCLLSCKRGALTASQAATVREACCAMLQCTSRVQRSMHSCSRPWSKTR